jgi:hypothetical protein
LGEEKRRLGPLARTPRLCKLQCWRRWQIGSRAGSNGHHDVYNNRYHDFYNNRYDGGVGGY